ncbi:MAG: KilA-N domain-containing protein [Bacteroidota bacterium]
MKKELEVNGIKVRLIENKKDDFISLTDMTCGMREGSGLIGRWISNKNTLEYIGIWKQIHNPQFNYPEFGVIGNESGVNRFVMSVGQWIDITYAIKENLIPTTLTNEQASMIYASEADLLNVALFEITAQKWREHNPLSEGNIRDQTTLEQLVVLSNMESINALLIQQGISSQERIIQLNQVAISQMKSLVSSKQINFLVQ